VILVLRWSHEQQAHNNLTWLRPYMEVIALHPVG
jgi:hypothetical protein